jgi:hypothetical protein
MSNFGGAEIFLEAGGVSQNRKFGTSQSRKQQCSSTPGIFEVLDKHYRCSRVEVGWDEGAVNAYRNWWNEAGWIYSFGDVMKRLVHGRQHEIMKRLRRCR